MPAESDLDLRGRKCIRSASHGEPSDSIGTEGLVREARTTTKMPAEVEIQREGGDGELVENEDGERWREKMTEVATTDLERNGSDAWDGTEARYEEGTGEYIRSRPLSGRAGVDELTEAQRKRMSVVQKIAGTKNQDDGS